MIKEVVDKNSGAILFKKDEESLSLEYLLKKVNELENRIKVIEEKQKEDS